VRRSLVPLLLGLALLLGLGALTPPSYAVPGDLTLVGPTGTVRAGSTQTFTATWAPSATPTAGVTVTLTGPGSATQTVTTGPDGRAVFAAVVPAGTTTYTATAEGETASVQATGGQLASRVALAGTLGATRVLRIAWTTSDGAPVSAPVTLYRRLGAGAFVRHTTLTTAADGTAAITVPLRTAYGWRATVGAGAGWLAGASGILETAQMPAVDLPGPSPAATPRQGAGSGTGAAAVVSTVPTSTWRTMVGRSWHRGCPVGRASLRLVRVNYWGFDGVRYRGEMVLNKAVAGRAAGALRTMYEQGFPIRRMYRVDRFGWSAALRGANDYASMRADNTSGFNCRSVVNKAWVRSPHASGRAIDLNTWENPYRSRTGLVPHSWWAPRSHPLVAWRSASHPVVRIWRSYGFRWTYGTGDSQHVDGRLSPTVAGTFTG
jgi:hypothetical protein